MDMHCSAERSTVPKLHLAMGRFGFSWWNRSQIFLVTKELLFIQLMQHRQQHGRLPPPHLEVAFGGNCLWFSFHNRSRPCLSCCPSCPLMPAVVVAVWKGHLFNTGHQAPRIMISASLEHNWCLLLQSCTEKNCSKYPTSSQGET